MSTLFEHYPGGKQCDGNSTLSGRITSQSWDILQYISGNVKLRKWSRCRPQGICLGSSAPSLNLNPSSILCHHFPSPCFMQLLIRIRCACQLESLPEMKMFVIDVPLYLVSFDAALETELSCLLTASWQPPTFCHACMHINIVGNTFSGLQLVAFRPMCFI